MGVSVKSGMSILIGCLLGLSLVLALCPAEFVPPASCGSLIPPGYDAAATYEGCGEGGMTVQMYGVEGLACTEIGYSACCAPGETVHICENGVDDDSDGLADCGDPDCYYSPPCRDVTTTNTDSSSSTTSMNDADLDGVIDQYDRCPSTPAGTPIIDPSSFVAYAGCSCDQIRPLFPSANPCVSFFCYETTLTIRYNDYAGTLVDCPDDYCDAFTFHDYPPDGYPRCAEGMIQNYSCEPVVFEKDLRCGFGVPETIALQENVSSETTTNVATSVPSTETTSSSLATTTDDVEYVNASATNTIPQLSGNVQRFYLTNAEIRLSWPLAVMEGDDASLTLLFLFQGSLRKRVTLNLALKDDVVSVAREYCAEDETGKLFCVARWNLPARRAGDYDFSLSISYDPGDGSLVQESFPVGLQVRQRPFAPAIIPDSTAVIGHDAPAARPTAPLQEDEEPSLPQESPVAHAPRAQLTSQEQAFIMAVHEELSKRELADPEGLEDFVRKVERASERIEVRKVSSFNNTRNATKVTLMIEPQKGVLARNVSVIEYIPKEVAPSVDAIEFSVQPTRVINDDPLIMWDFAVVEGPIDLSYEVKGEATATGNTIVATTQVEPKLTAWHVAAPMLVIPFVVIMFIVLPRIVRRRQQ